MEPKQTLPNYDLDSPDLEIFSSTLPQKSAKKGSRWQNFFNKFYIKTALTLFLLFSLFSSTFLIASRIRKPAFTTSSANIGYIPEAQIEIPKIVRAKSCSEVDSDTEMPTFLQSFCQGIICSNQEDKESCESIDVIVLKDGYLSEESGHDRVPDCVWLEEEAICKPIY